ncbi:LEAF RUST 10 DISEASE-RESISTANCE LOCUS RECEPTOR-LIKE PROTEIN KINASE-like 2.8 [Zea mays]|uniref:LEAF RUST 10 DISEASE-RESISTANCE LOCUS RECEPTOR-LIKE PROTEIN KINASE-like 2.8 n=1 Tax=Zea mays TaxID=4577 RepID=A0A3L6FLU8_MAIZE|nr:LEAF RUST 10 DISEASE-RESISTANCE LOCUS RECEPTOR-LIKE PROTEIN KINASE-like 2.8 [Zea mays]
MALVPSSLLLFLVSSSAWVALSLPLPVAAAHGGQGGQHCSPFLCGNVKIAFPFGLIPEGATQTSCGAGFGFQVRCYDTIPHLGYYQNEISLEILIIFYHNRSLILADRPSWHTYFNTTTSTKGCQISDNQNLIFYSCTKPPSPGEGLVGTACHNNTFVRAADGRSDESGGYVLEGCTATRVPVLGVSGKVNASNYDQLVWDGFLATWQLPPTPSGTNGNGRKTKLIIAAASLFLPCIYVLVWHRQKLRFFLCKKTSSSIQENIEALISSYGSLAPKRYKYSEVTKITSCINNKLGEGGYGVVFKGRLDDSRLVAVKFLHDSKGDGEEFVNEVMSIGRTSHINIVSLFGFCLEGSKRALIYEYMPNGSLDKYIYSDNPKEVLGWDKLYTIAIGIARGLEYLHHSCNTRIVHFDIKPQNILLDQNFQPKVADFGLAKLCHTKESKLSMTGARGTPGFIAPEVHSRTFGVVSTKSDVYSYGMMLLEMVGGRKNVKSFAQVSSEKYFPHWIYDHFGQNDGLLACEGTPEKEEIAKKMVVVGMWCIQVLPLHRPTITKVLEMFDRCLDELDMPPRQNFSQTFEDPTYNFNAENMSTSSGTKTQR